MLKRNEELELKRVFSGVARETISITLSRRWYLYFCIAAVLLALGISPGRIATPDAHLRLAQARHFVESGSITVPDGVGNPLHGNLVTANNGHRYSVYNIGQIALFIPLAWIAIHINPVAGLDAHYTTEFFAAFLGPIVHLLTSVLIIAIFELLGASRRRAAVMGFVYAFATFGLPHAMDGYEHPYEALGIAASIYSILRAQKYDPVVEKTDWKVTAWYFSAGCTLGLAALFRNSVWASAPGLLLLVRSWNGRLAFIGGILPSVCIILLYNYIRFGSSLETGYTQAWQTANPGLHGASGFSLLSIPQHVLGLWVSSGKGMLLYSPILLALIVSPFVGVSRQFVRLAFSMISMCILYNVLYGANFAWHGSEWCWGPRYLVPTLVPLIILLGLTLPHRGILRASWGFLLCISVVVQVIAMSVSYQRSLLAMYNADPTSFTQGRVLYNLSYSPLFRQFTSLREVSLRTISPTKLELFISPGPWRNEARPASLQAMLDSSIDLNSFNFWWVRLWYFPLSAIARSIGFLIGLSMLLSASVLLCLIYRHRSPVAVGSLH